MKNLIIGVVCGLIAVCTGCKSVPTVEKMYSISTAVGYTAGLVANESKIDDATRNAIVEVVNEVKVVLPATNETFEAAWTPIAQAHTDKLVADGKITKEQGVLVMAAFNLAVNGLDYIFEVRYPKAKEYKDLTIAAVDGFTSGFLTVFKPVNVCCASKTTGCEFDRAAYQFLKK